MHLSTSFDDDKNCVQRCHFTIYDLRPSVSQQQDDGGWTPCDSQDTDLLRSLNLIQQIWPPKAKQSGLVGPDQEPKLSKKRNPN